MAASLARFLLRLHWFIPLRMGPLLSIPIPCVSWCMSSKRALHNYSRVRSTRGLYVAWLTDLAKCHVYITAWVAPTSYIHANVDNLAFLLEPIYSRVDNTFDICWWRSTWMVWRIYFNAAPGTPACLGYFGGRLDHWLRRPYCDTWCHP